VQSNLRQRREVRLYHHHKVQITQHISQLLIHLTFLCGLASLFLFSIMGCFVLGVVSGAFCPRSGIRGLFGGSILSLPLHFNQILNSRCSNISITRSSALQKENYPYTLFSRAFCLGGIDLNHRKQRALQQAEQ
jgi:hypothetical protein